MLQMLYWQTIQHVQRQYLDYHSTTCAVWRTRMSNDNINKTYCETVPRFVKWWGQLHAPQRCCQSQTVLQARAYQCVDSPPTIYTNITIVIIVINQHVHDSCVTLQPYLMRTMRTKALSDDTRYLGVSLAAATRCVVLCCSAGSYTPPIASIANSTSWRGLYTHAHY